MSGSAKDVLRGRLEEKLARECGETVLAALRNPAVVEIMLNPDGRVWLDVAGEGMQYSGSEMSPAAAESMLTTCASMLNTSITYDNPILEGEFPLDGSRLEGIIAPIVRTPVFTIRKKATKVFTLDDYCARGIIGAVMPAARRLDEEGAETEPDFVNPVEAIRHAVVSRKNILIVGGTGSGKTTLANAVLAEIASLASEDRLVAIEDTVELQIKMPNSVLLRSNERIPMQRLLRATMRLRPDRIVVGEVRGGEALTLLKSWNTGHPGGVATIHANSAQGGLLRLMQLVYEAPEAANLSESAIGTMIAEAVNMVLFIERSHDAGGRRVSEIVNVNGFENGLFRCSPIVVRSAVAV
ncbi:P-type conjugative transfer ATPase TrbB [Chitinimonas arctica]|uniref:P-type conjugative transfer ATPase TrbB n=1 Tax=Chitinimonas arctica TaxID=2594795 RepID=A0A516SHC9_9NEIS|nr:ATPase, T2SS/T4P/T4SS family [Chitinimonas arctica]QDQ27566.1 P-type conjugative transfer ATPase TrbB [Chitinimonas arctica]